MATAAAQAEALRTVCSTLCSSHLAWPPARAACARRKRATEAVCALKLCDALPQVP